MPVLQIKILVFSLFLLTSAHLHISPLRQERPDFQVRISMYEVPSMMVSRTSTSKVNKDGSIEGVTVGGNTTASFPAGVVILENKLSERPVDATIKRAIREYMAYDCLRPQDVHVWDLARHDFCFDDKALECQEIDQKVESGFHKLFYRLRIVLEWIDEEQAGLALQVWMRHEKYSEIQVTIAQSPEHQLLNQITAVKFGQMSLVGFPSSDQKPRTIYWLAVSATK